MKIKVGDMLKWHKNNTVNGIAIVVREYGQHYDKRFDVCWLDAKGFEADYEASTGYNESWLDKAEGWSKLS